MTGERGDRPPGQKPAPATAPTSGGALGTGLLILGLAVGALLLLWLLANLIGGQIGPGGLIFGLILLLVIAGPLAGAGWYLRRRGAVEQAEAVVYSGRRGVLDNDRVVRRQLARELEQRAGDLERRSTGLPPADADAVRLVTSRLRDLRGDVLAPGYDSATWLEQTAASLDDAELAQVRRYDDLVLEEVRRLEELSTPLGSDPATPARLTAATALLAQHVGEREALLGRGQRGSGLAPQEILSAGLTARRRLETPLELRLEDAVTYRLDDYVVRGVVTYFAGEREWRAYQLHDGKQEHWLEVRGGGTDVSWYTLTPGEPPADSGRPGGGRDAEGDAGAAVTRDGVTFTPAEAGSASVGVESAAGKREGIFVEYRRYRGADGQRLVVERWPDGPRTLVGEAIEAEDLDLWTKPAATE